MFAAHRTVADGWSCADISQVSEVISHIVCGGFAFWSSPLSHHIHLLLCSVCSLPFRGSSLWPMWLCSLWLSEGIRVAGRLWSVVFATRDLQFDWPCFRVSVIAFLRSVLGARRSLQAIWLCLFCCAVESVYCICTVVCYVSYCFQLSKHASWWVGSCALFLWCS